MTASLSRSQQLAIEHITKYAASHKDAAERTIQHVLRMSNIDPSTFEEASAKLKTQARIALHFHPDRPDPVMKSIAQALLEQGVYKSQFETRISNGSVSPHPGGERDLWEKMMFGGAYQIEGSRNSQRPKYGALNVMLHADGPAPRFGSCYFLLSPKVSRRSTYTYLDSHQDPKEKGTYEEFDMILAALMEDVFVNESALGEKDLTPRKWVEHMLVNFEKPFSDPSTKEPRRNLNHYIEAQVHGDVSLQDDVEALVADPSFKDTQVGIALEQICEKYAIDLFWHMGFVLLLDDVPIDFRGPSMPALAERVAQSHFIDASMIGAAAMDLKRDPGSWSDRGSYDQVLQELKLLWHVLVRYGKPRREFV